jgi:hypothetical protein
MVSPGRFVPRASKEQDKEPAVLCAILGGTRPEIKRQRWCSPSDRKWLCVCAVPNETLTRQSSWFLGTRRRSKRSCQCASNETSGCCPSCDRSRCRIRDRSQFPRNMEPRIALRTRIGRDGRATTALPELARPSPAGFWGQAGFREQHTQLHGVRWGPHEPKPTTAGR